MMSDAITTYSYCYNPLEVNGTLAGHDDSIPFGTVTNTVIPGGQHFYTMTADLSNDEWIVKAGSAGDERIYNPDKCVVIRLEIAGIGIIELSWDDTHNYYKGVDIRVSDFHALIGTEVCYNMRLYGCALSVGGANADLFMLSGVWANQCELFGP